jgi:DNA-binding beta-propeller fold protein YncE
MNNRIAVWTRQNETSADWSFSTTFGSEGEDDDQFRDPSAVVVSPDGLTVWVADAGNHRIAIWTRDNTGSTIWNFSTTFGSVGSGNDEFLAPRGVAVSPDGLTAWVADTGNNRVAIWTRENAGSTEWSFSAKFGALGSGNDEFSDPFGVAVSSDGLVAWVADTANNRIAVWTRQNAGSTEWSYSTQLGTGTAGSGNNAFRNPVSVTVSPNGMTAWVADTFNNRVAIWENLTCPA